MGTRARPAPPGVVAMTIPEVAHALRCSTAKVYALARDHGLPVVALGGGDRRVGVARLVEWLNSLPTPDLDQLPKTGPDDDVVDLDDETAP